MEIWKRIETYSDYEVSNKGRVKSYKRKTPFILRPAQYSNGYLFVHLSNGIESHSCLIHQLVLCAFKPCEQMDTLQVNHLNCIRSDNRLENLEWSTGKQNLEYRDQLKHTPKAEIIWVQFLDDREDLIFDSMTSCANYFGITRKAINRYLNSQNIRKDRKVQAHFYRLGNTYKLNS